MVTVFPLVLITTTTHTPTHDQTNMCTSQMAASTATAEQPKYDLDNIRDTYPSIYLSQIDPEVTNKQVISAFAALNLGRIRNIEWKSAPSYADKTTAPAPPKSGYVYMRQWHRNPVADAFRTAIMEGDYRIICNETRPMQLLRIYQKKRSSSRAAKDT